MNDIITATKELASASAGSKGKSSFAAATRALAYDMATIGSVTMPLPLTTVEKICALVDEAKKNQDGAEGGELAKAVAALEGCA